MRAGASHRKRVKLFLPTEQIFICGSTSRPPDEGHGTSVVPACNSVRTEFACSRKRIGPFTTRGRRLNCTRSDAATRLGHLANSHSVVHSLRVDKPVWRVRSPSGRNGQATRADRRANVCGSRWNGHPLAKMASCRSCDARDAIARQVEMSGQPKTPLASRTNSWMAPLLCQQEYICQLWHS
jgi:hypothetical protein